MQVAVTNVPITKVRISGLAPALGPLFAWIRGGFFLVSTPLDCYPRPTAKN
jgi:hypothetical protein